MSEKQIKVGDFVTYRSRPNALGVTGCKVLELGETANGEAAALLDLGQFGQHAALVSHLHPENEEEEPKE